MCFAMLRVVYLDVRQRQVVSLRFFTQKSKLLFGRVLMALCNRIEKKGKIFHSHRHVNFGSVRKTCSRLPQIPIIQKTFLSFQSFIRCMELQNLASAVLNSITS